jgi:glycosyltransferase involved in cell wall biosynthesis
MLDQWPVALLSVVAAVHLAASLSVLVHLRWARRLPRLEGPAATGRPRVSVVLAARDEEERIESTVRRLLAQVEVDLEVIAVDDRSSDRTGDILRRLAGEDPRVKALRVETLPEGWLGKCHACHLGAAASSGEWILFTDADCWLKDDALARALRVAEHDGVEHITLTAGVTPESSAAARAWHVAFLLTLASWFSGVNRDKPGRYLGMGAFNLVRADAYRACGGYEALRLTVLDDVRLGLLLQRAGKRTRGFIGGNDAQCHWSATARGMIRIMEKNYFAAMDYRTGVAFGAALFGLVFWGGALLGAVTCTWAGGAAFAGLLSWSVPAALVASRLGWSRSTALLVPFIFPLLFHAMLNSALVTLRQGGVRWRDTFYPLAVLRRGGIR